MRPFCVNSYALVVLPAAVELLVAGQCCYEPEPGAVYRSVPVRLERNQALIDERVRDLVHAVPLERLDGEAIDASVGNVRRRAFFRYLGRTTLSHQKERFRHTSQKSTPRAAGKNTSKPIGRVSRRHLPESYSRASRSRLSPTSCIPGPTSGSTECARVSK